jgi:4-amino-4-deoxy-L-arabinose transferase-like glycosyltransferase
MAIAVMAIVLILSIRQESVTIDESLHIPAGISYWQARDLRLNLEHPPLLKMWATLPLMFRHAAADYQSPAWTGGVQDDFAHAILQQWNPDIESLVFWARIPMVLVTLALGLSIFHIARSLAGSLGGFLSLLFFVTAPFFLAYGPLVLTDAGLALFTCWTLWTFGSLWRDPSTMRAVACALALSGALLSKFSSVLLFPTLVIAAGLFSVEEAYRTDSKPDFWSLFAPVRSRLRFLAAALIGSFGIVYIFYAVAGYRGPASVVFASKIASSPTRLGFLTKLVGFLRAHPIVDRLSSPILLYVSGMGRVLVGVSRRTFILGHWYSHGRWFYFPVLFLFKMTPGFLGATLLLGFLAGGYFLRKPGRQPIVAPQFQCSLQCLVTGFFVFVGAAIFSSLNIGIRHLSVPVALLTIFLSLTIPLLSRQVRESNRRALAFLTFLLIASSAYSTLKAFPSYISYFNVLIGPQPKYHVSVDSNLDWGQALPAVREFSRMHPGGLAIDYFGGIDPRMYVPNGIPWACDTPLPAGTAWAVVTATSFVERGHCDYLLAYAHWVLDGGSSLVFRIAPTPFKPSAKE